jgi:flagellar biosynthesis/type III secretory pathway protein FliH
LDDECDAEELEAEWEAERDSETEEAIEDATEERDEAIEEAAEELRDVRWWNRESGNGVQLGCRHGSKDGDEDDGDTHVGGLMDCVWVGCVEFVSKNRVS